MTEEELNERQRRRRVLLLIPLLLLGASLCFWTLFASVSLGEAESFIPAPLGSDALANYGKDDIPGRLRSLSISIVEAVIRDRDPKEEDVDSRVEDVIDSLKSPVPTVPGAATGTPTSLPTPTVTLDPAITPSITPTASASPLPLSTSTATDIPTAGPTPTPSKTPTPSATPLCTATPYIEIKYPTASQRFTLATPLPGQAFAFDPDNVNPLTCSVTPSSFPLDDGEGISGDPEVEMRVEWWNGSSWVLVHTEMENSKAYCPFGDIDPFCETHDLSTGEWPDSTPINAGKHRLKAKVLQDDEGVSSGWVWAEFYIDPSISIEDVSSTEGSDLTFTVTLDITVGSAFTVDVSLTDVTATGGSPLVSPKDYDNFVATLNFAGTAGETQQFTVATLDDAVLEGTETFTVSLNSSYPLMTDSDTAFGTITDNDLAAVMVDSVTVTEGAGLLFTVTLNNAVASAFNVNVSLADVTAAGGNPLVSGLDYDNFVSALNFAGSAGETQQFTVATLNDATIESTETFTVSLNALNPLVTDSGTGTGTITDNDVVVCPDFSILNSSDDGNKEVWFDVDNIELVPVTIDRIVMDWNGSGNLDWIKLGGTLIWNTSLPDPVDITGGWAASTVIDPSPSKELRFGFTSSVTGVYDVTVYSNNGCVASDSQDAG